MELGEGEGEIGSRVCVLDGWIGLDLRWRVGWWLCHQSISGGSMGDCIDGDDREC